MLADPGDHFVGRFEVESKFAVKTLGPVRSRLERIGATPFVLGNIETDVFLDLADDPLAKAGRTHVLRKMLPSGRVLWIVKGPRTDECVAMDLSSRSKAETMLNSLGFEERGRLTKRRDIYFVHACHVTLDEVDELGTFVEVAGMTDDEVSLTALRENVADIVAQIGLSDHEPIRSSYIKMLAADQAIMK